jgi:hypothetical protein
MALTDRELWTVIHGMLLGALFVLAYSVLPAQPPPPQRDSLTICL